MTIPAKRNLSADFAGFRDCWSPRIAGEVNDTHIKLVKLEGAFAWHHHAHEDELFLVHKGRLRMKFRDGDVVLEPDEFIIVPRGVEHCPVAEDGVCEVMLVEPKSTLNTGTIESERTVHAPALLD